MPTQNRRRTVLKHHEMLAVQRPHNLVLLEREDKTQKDQRAV